jgi:uncharacterized protein YuzE
MFGIEETDNNVLAITGIDLSTYIWTEYLQYRAHARKFDLAIKNREIYRTMKKPKMFYFAKEDILHLVMSHEEEANSVELSPNITAELNAQGELIGLEILQASTFVRDSILEAAQAKLLNLSSPEQ